MSSALRQPRSGAVMLEESLQRDIRRALHSAGVESCAAFVLVEFGDTGLRASVVDAASGASVVEHGNGRLCPRMLDLTLADHLVRIGRVTRPESTDWAAELIGLLPQVRDRLSVVDGAFAMGTEHVAMFRMSRKDCITALSAELSDAADVITRTVDEAAAEIGAVVVMPDHETWPGLLGELAERLPFSVVALEGHEDDAEAGRHTVGDVASEGDVVVDETVDDTTPAAIDAEGSAPDPITGDETVADDAPGETVVDETTPEESAPEEAALDETAPAAPEPWFPEASDVTQPISVVRTAEPPAGAVQQGGAGVPATTSTVSADVLPSERIRNTGVAATGDHDIVRDDHIVEPVVTGQGPRTYTPPGNGSGRAAGPVGRRRLAVGAIAVGGAVALGGAILAVPWLHGADGRPAPTPAVVGFTAPNSAAATQPPTTRPPSTQTPATPGPAPAQTSGRPPIDVGPAQAPALQYAPPPTQQSGGGYVSPGQPRRPAPRPVFPRRRTIPNPIPGLPPIVLP